MADKKMRVTGQQNWSDLPHDILLLVSSKLESSLFDKLSLKGVCSSWRIAFRNMPKRPYPILVLFGNSKGNLLKEGINHFYLFIVNQKTPHKLKNTPMYIDHSSSRIIGSHPDGWLILSDKHRVAYLFHLLLQIKIYLPNNILDTDGKPITIIGNQIGKAVLSANDPNRPEDFIVVMTYRDSIGRKMLVFCRHGHGCWTFFGDGEVDDIAIRNNTIYAIAYGYVEIWDLKPNRVLPTDKFHIPLRASLFDHGSLSLIVPSTDQIFVQTIAHSSKCSIHKVDSTKRRFRKLNSSGGHTLLACYGDSSVLCSVGVQLLGYKADTIDFTQKQQHIKLGNCCVGDSKPQRIQNLMRPRSQPQTFWMVITV